MVIVCVLACLFVCCNEHSLWCLLEVLPFTGTQVCAPWKCRFTGSFSLILAGPLAQGQVHPFLILAGLVQPRRGWKHTGCSPRTSGIWDRGEARGTPQDFSLSLYTLILNLFFFPSQVLPHSKTILFYCRRFTSIY